MAEPARLADFERHAAGASPDFAVLVRTHQSMVFSLALHLLRDRAAAEEVAQDVFVELHKNLTALRSPEHILFWLRKVTSHRSIDYARRRKRHEVCLADPPEVPCETSRRDPLLGRRLRQLVRSLPVHARMVVVLRYQEDLLPAEIAQLLDMPVATVKSHLQRSLTVLRGKLLRLMGDVRQ